ncbi:MAG: 3'-5' exonuclease, partial [Quisquiliibacterium sp.]
PLFMVGDPKQAIYGFRSADLYTYLKARNTAGHHYTLQRNQRSQAALVKALNRLFGVNPDVFMLPGLHYHQVRSADRTAEALRDPASSAALQVWLLPQDDSGQGFRPIEQARQASAAAVAAEIARMLGQSGSQQVRIGHRGLNAKDIAVLVRTHAEGRRMRTALAQHGVGSVERSTQSVFLSSQAEQIEQLLTAVLEPTRDGLVRCALATEAVGMNAAQIQALDEDEAAYSLLAQQFASLRHDWHERGVGYMLRRWLQQQQVAERLLSRLDGERQLTNLLHLVEILHQASALHPSPVSLLRWLRAQRSKPDAHEQTLLRLESDENLVQIVTIHASKGLEYPIVFCPFLWRDPSAPQGRLEGNVYHDEDGELVIDYRDGLDDQFDPESIKFREWLERAAEFERLIYVALTRAVHRCILVAGCHGQPRSSKPVTNTLLNWIVAGKGVSPRQWRDQPVSADQVHQSW